METISSVRRERKDAQRNRARVIQAAHELFAERGAEMTIEEVAARAGVGVGTIYRCFSNKDQLMAEVSRAACADMQHCIYEAAAAASDPVAKLRALFVFQYRRGAQQAPLLEIQLAGEGDHRSFAEQQQLYAALHAMIRQIIAEGQRQGMLRSGDAAILAALCLELISPRACQNLTSLADGDAEAVADQAILFVLGGLGACR